MPSWQQARGRGAFGQYEALVHTAKMRQERYLKRLENTVALLLEKVEESPEEKNSTDNLLKQGLLNESEWDKNYHPTAQKLHHLFFAKALALDNSEEAAIPPAPEKLSQG